MNEANGNSRLDRIELDLEKLVGVVHELADHVQVLTDQTQVLADHARATNAFLQQTAEAQLRLATAQNETEDRLNALIKIVDGLIRKPPSLEA